MVKRIGFIVEERTILCAVLVFSSLLWSTTETTTTTPEIETPPTLVERVPSKPPANLTVTSLDPFLHCNSCMSCIRVEWDPPPVEDRNGMISLYEIHYVGREFDTNPRTDNVTGDVHSVTLPCLEEYVVYDVKIRAYNHNGSSPYSSVQSVRTYAVPPGRPTNVSFLNVTSISGVDGLVDLKVTWSLSPRNVNGLFAGFRVRYQCSSDNSSMNEEVHNLTTCCHDCRIFVCALAENITEHVITNLTSYSWYKVYVYALSKDESLGFLYVSGWTSSDVLTAESKPTGAPRNMSVVNIVGGMELLVEWNEVSCTEINGLLKEYIIYYRRESDAEVLNDTAFPNSTNFTISNLEPLSEYVVWMQAVNGAGEGPLTAKVKARTAQRVCKCFSNGSLNENCNQTTGQCSCSDGAYGQNCDTCIRSLKRFENIDECLDEIDYTPFNCLDFPLGWRRGCSDVARASPEPTPLNVSATIVSGDSALRDYVDVYWNGWTCFFDCQLTFTLKVYVLESQGSILKKPSQFSTSQRIRFQPVSYPIQVHLTSGMNMIELTVSNDRTYTPNVVRSYVLVDKAEGSSVALSTRDKLYFTSTNGNSHWQTDRNERDLSVSWKNHFYNTYIKTNSSLLYRIERPQTGKDLIALPLSFSGIPTYHDSGIMSFEMTLYRNDSLIASRNFTALEHSYDYRHSKLFQSGETFRVSITAIDVFEHEASSSAFVYTDFSRPLISDVKVWKREHSPIRDLNLCSKEETGSVYTLEVTAIDEESGIKTIEWKTSTSTSDQIDSQSQLRCQDSDTFCYCALDGVCLSKTFTSKLENFEEFEKGNLRIRATSRSGLISKWRAFPISSPMTAAISPSLQPPTPTNKTITVTWSLNDSSKSFLVIVCQKDSEKCVACYEVSVNGSQREATVKDLKPATTYRVQIEALNGNSSGLSAPKETNTLEGVPEGSPIGIKVSSPSNDTVVQWNPPDRLYQNGNITKYEVEVEIENEGQWILAQAVMTIDAPETNTTVNNLLSGRKHRTRVSAATAIGLGPPSAYYDFTTPEDVPDVPPSNVLLINATSSSLTISWSAIPNDSRNGVLREYVVAYVAQKGDESEKEVEVAGTETEATLTGLSPYTFYVVKLSGRTNKGPGPVSDDLFVQTSEGLSGPPLLERADASSLTTISVGWKAPSKPNGRILDYRFFVSPIIYSSNRDSVAYFTAQGDKSNKILTNLVPGTNYSMYLQARTSQGLGEPTETVYVATLKQIIGAPQELNATSNEPDSISVSWLAPNGSVYVNISVYVIMYGVANDWKQNVTTKNVSYVLTGLSPYTYYQIEVKADGGNASAVTFAFTLEGTPGPLESFRISVFDESSILLEWEPPSSPNGRIAYRYRITETATGFTQDVDLLPGQLDLADGRFFRWKVANLTGYTEYQLSMQAFNILHNDNVGPRSNLLVNRTKEGKPGPPDAVRVIATREASLIVFWSPPKKPNGIITGYEIASEWANKTGAPKTYRVIHVNDPKARFQNVEGLESYANYSVIVRAITSSGEGAASEKIVEFTKCHCPDALAPRNVNDTYLTSTSVTLIWERPSDHKGLLNYTLYVEQLDERRTVIKRFFSKDVTSDTVEGLETNTLFSAKIVAGFLDNSEGDSDPLIFQTPPSAPSSAPRNFTVSRTEESSSLLLSWISVFESDLNGVLCRYVVRYSPKNISKVDWRKKEIEARSHETLLTDLAPYTEYHVEIAAETCSVSGVGPYAYGRNRTGEGVPNKPDVSLLDQNSTWIKVNWTVEPNGILHRVDANISSSDQDISFNQGEVYNTSNVTGEAEFFGLKPYHTYTVSIGAYSGRGAGLPGTLSVSTCGEAPLSAALNLTCELLDDNRNEIRLNYTDISMSDWRGERLGYRVYLFKGNETSIRPVRTDDPVGKSGGESNFLSSQFSIDLDHGWYTVTLEAESDSKCNKTNNGASSDPCSFFIPKPPETLPRTDNGDNTMTMVIILASSVAALLIIVLVIVIVCVRKRRRQAKLEVIQLQELQNRRQTHWLMTWPTYDEFQFSKERLKIEDELGEGQFGKVYFAWATGIVKGEEQTRVAVKTMKQGSSQETAEDFRKEMEIMMDFDHPNIVRLLGICTRDEPLYLITELMKHGDLKAFIRKARPNETHRRSFLSVVQLVDIAAQAAAGVAYLASRLFVHRDIAARNCLVGENNNQLSVKVSDFGMARDIYQEEYYRRKGGTMPIRWMAPEAITDGKYTVESDVWSLGVLLWEIFVFGYQPYFGKSNEQVIGGVLQGNLSLECPSLCPKSVYQFMLRCWERNPSDRIKSSDVANALQAMRDMGDISAGHLDMSSTESKTDDYTPMGSFTPPNSKFEEEPLLPQSNNAYYLDMSGGKARSASSGQKRYVSAEPKKKVPLAGTSYVNAAAQDLSNTTASHLNIASTQSKMPVEDDYTPMNSFSPRRVMLDPMNKEVSLPDIITMNDGNPLRDEPAEVEEKKEEKKLSSQMSTTYVNVMASTEDLDCAIQKGKDGPSA